MKRINALKRRLRAGTSLAVAAAAAYAASRGVATAADTNAPTAKVEQKAAQKVVKKKLTGAELYAINCNRCHAERYPTEWTAAQWKTLMTHMRVRANLPAAQAKTILKYLQEDSGS